MSCSPHTIQPQACRCWAGSCTQVYRSYATLDHHMYRSLLSLFCAWSHRESPADWFEIGPTHQILTFCYFHPSRARINCNAAYLAITREKLRTIAFQCNTDSYLRGWHVELDICRCQATETLNGHATIHICSTFREECMQSIDTNSNQSGILVSPRVPEGTSLLPPMPE